MEGLFQVQVALLRRAKHKDLSTKYCDMLESFQATNGLLLVELRVQGDEEVSMMNSSGRAGTRWVTRVDIKERGRP